MSAHMFVNFSQNKINTLGSKKFFRNLYLITVKFDKIILTTLVKNITNHNCLHLIFCKSFSIKNVVNSWTLNLRWKTL